MRRETVDRNEITGHVEIVDFEEAGETVTADSRGRIVLGATVKDERFAVRRDRLGRILLTPVVTIPKHELWLWENPAALASVRQGLAEAAAGLGKPASFAQYADIEIED